MGSCVLRKTIGAVANMPLDYHIACPVAARAYNVALEAVSVHHAHFFMPTFLVTLSDSVVAMRIRAPFIPSVVSQESGTTLRAFLQRPPSLYVLAELIYRRKSKSRTSRWWTTAICGLLKFWGITHFVSSLESCVGGATAIAFGRSISGSKSSQPSQCAPRSSLHSSPELQ